ncbi:hypothetical protein BJV74DRAFT_797991 [Russula compacta]|nr:hypothetical protein BJV74DRAFT_797991 [Russula compacta]
MRAGLDVHPGTPSARPRSPLVHTASPGPLEPLSKSPPLPSRSPLRPPARSAIASVDALIQDMPSPILRVSSSTTFSIDTLVDTLPTTNIIIDGPFLNEKSKGPPFLSMSRTPSPDKPLPTTPLSPSPPNSINDSTLDSPSVRDPIDYPPPSATLPPKAPSTGLSKRTHALLELIESERAYASDLALIRDIHLPVALGNEPPIPTPPRSSSSSIRTLSNASGSSTTLLGPPMTQDDARIIFSNLPELAELTEDFLGRLEIALGDVLPGGEGQDRVGAFFIDMIPRMESPYMHYITHHPASLTHLNSLPQTPALAAYHAKTRTLAQQLSHAWDLPSLLIKPVQRLLKYALLLHAIIEATPDSHGDKESLRRAKAMVEAVSHAINEGQRRREIVKEVFAAGKPAELLKKKGLGIVGRVRGGVTTPRSISRTDGEEPKGIVQMEHDMHVTDEFIQKFAKETLEWVKSVQAIMSALRGWAEGFGRVIGLGPDVTSEAYDAFLVVIDKQLSVLCVDLEALVHEQLLPQLRILLDTIKRPALLLETLHALEPHHNAFLQHNPAKGRPPSALNEASARLWRDVRTRWSDLWDALRVEGEMNAGSEETSRVWRARWEEAARDFYTLNIIHPENLTPRSKQARIATTTSPPSPTVARVGAVHEPARSAPADSASFADFALSAQRKRSFNLSAPAHRLAHRPSTESMQSIRSAMSSSGHGHHRVEALEITSIPPRHPMPRRQSMPMSLHHSSSQGRLLDSFGRDGREKEKQGEEDQRARGGGTIVKQTIVESLLPSLPRRNVVPRRGRASDAHHHLPPPHASHVHQGHGLGHGHRHRPHPPMPPTPQLTVSSRWYRAPTMYACRVVHECEPPEGVEYYGLPFFRLFVGDVYHVLKEAGHPSRHRDLPLQVDEGEDCLLLARDSSGELGWLLASFLFPVD